VQPSSLTCPRLSTLSITTFLLADSIALASQMTHQLLLRQSSVCQIGAPVVRTSGSLYGGATGFNSRADSFLWIYQWSRSCCWWFSEPPLHKRHHSVYIWPLFGHCANKPPNELQRHTTLLPRLLNVSKLSKTKCMLFNQLLPAPNRPTSITTRFWLRICGQLQIPRCLVRL
jgi:hypothetical protein